jgi:parvulin-like peptidyl-prolyl isomerase
VKYALVGQPERDVDEATLLNRIIGDVLVLQAAAEAGVSVDREEVQAEIDAILKRMDVSEEEMTVVLDDHELSWADFEISVREYLVIGRFQNAVLLADKAPDERQDSLRNWMSEQYSAADMIFNQDFLDEVNASQLPSSAR